MDEKELENKNEQKETLDNADIGKNKRCNEARDCNGAIQLLSQHIHCFRYLYPCVQGIKIRYVCSKRDFV